jgi:hypothetical protein
MLGKAAMIAVLLMPTASIVRHDDHSTAAKPVRWFNVAASPRRMDDTRPRRVHWFLWTRLPSLRQPSREPSDHEPVAYGYCPHEVMLGSKRPQDGEHDDEDDEHQGGLSPK